jgi:hypothetical protein
MPTSKNLAEALSSQLIAARRLNLHLLLGLSNLRPEKAANEKLVRASRLKAFLEEFANLRSEEFTDGKFGPATTRFIRRFREFFPPSFPESTWASRKFIESGKDVLRVFNEMGFDPSSNKANRQGEDLSEAKLVQIEFIHLRISLLKAWLERFTREREWRIHGLQRSAAVLLQDAASSLQKPNQFDQANTLFLKIPISILYVSADPKWLGDDVMPPFSPIQQALSYLSKNASKLLVCPNPTCATRLFFRNRPNQSFCSTECGAGSRSESKRNWWRTKGTEWRRERRNMTKSAKRSRLGKYGKAHSNV